MKQTTNIIRCAFLASIVWVYSCSKDDSVNPNDTTAKGKTSLFEEVIEPEANQNNIGSEEGVEWAYMSDASYADGGRSTGGTADKGDGIPGGQFEPGILTAGEWNDLDNWGFWNDLLSNQEYFEDVNKWGLKEIKRYSFVVTDNKDLFVANAEISLLSNQVEVWKTKTDNTGQATLWSDKALNGLTATIDKGGYKEIVSNVKEYSEGTNRVQLYYSAPNQQLIDVFFAVDATGSMGDEIDYLKSEVNDVIKRIKGSHPLLDMRFGSVFYRDEGDEYVTRNFSFTSDEEALTTFISNQNARGGGDFPEAVHSALDVALHQNYWNDEASARLLFLLLDAPPHYTQEVISSLEMSLIKAAEKGIKIIPITASGIDKSTEYLMRSFAILTNGTYVFITDDSGVGNDHLEPTIGEFEVEKLNDLMVRLVGEYVP